MEYILPLRDVPLSYGELFLKSDVVLSNKGGGYRVWNIDDATYLNVKRSAIDFLPIAISLRPKGKRVLPAVVSTDSQLTVEKIQMTALSAQDRQDILSCSNATNNTFQNKSLTKQDYREAAKFDTRVVVTYRYRGPVQADGSWQETGGGGCYLTNIKGEKLDAEIAQRFADAPLPSRRFKETYYLSLKSIPHSHERLTLNICPYVNEYWPLHEKFVVREK